MKKILVGLLVCGIGMGAISSNTNVMANVTALEENTIGDSTIITRENLNQVLEYVNIPLTDFTYDSSVSSNTTTVGELKEAIEQAESHNSLQMLTVDAKPAAQDDTMNSMESSFMSARAISSKTLSETFDNDGYKLEISVTGQYTGTKWVGIGSMSASVDSDQVLIVYKIKSKSLSGSYTSKCITVTGTVSVDAYVGVGDMGVVKVGKTQDNTIRVNYYASDWL